MADNNRPSGFDLSTLPKRVTSRVDLESAQAWLDTIQANGAASDMQSYETAEKARNAGLRAARSLAHVAPDGQRPTIRTFGVDAKGKPTNADPKGYAFAVTLKDEDEDEDEAETGEPAAE